MEFIYLAIRLRFQGNYMSVYNYRKQVSLLLKVLAQVAEEPVFALHGGTGINLFARNMPRLSIDIDLTSYLNIFHEKNQK